MAVALQLSGLSCVIIVCGWIKLSNMKERVERKCKHISETSKCLRISRYLDFLCSSKRRTQ
jgi:hypothetical protein